MTAFFKNAMSKPSIIAHRGNTKGRDKTRENHPDYLREALKEGYGVEYDVWLVDGLWVLGHDIPEYQVTWAWLQRLGSLSSANMQDLREPRAWMHCKNWEAYSVLNRLDADGNNKAKHLNYFWHEDDLFTTTSLGIMWMHPRAGSIPIGSAWVLPDRMDPFLNDENLVKARWVCTDDTEILSKVSSQR